MFFVIAYRRRDWSARGMGPSVIIYYLVRAFVLVHRSFSIYLIHNNIIYCYAIYYIAVLGLGPFRFIADTREKKLKSYDKLLVFLWRLQ